jgi:DNA-binding NtrC family response regulator
LGTRNPARRRRGQNLNQGMGRRISLRGVALILIVDPDPAVRSLIAVALEQQGFPTLAAANAGEAVTISQSRRGRLALLIADALMPEMGGRDLANAVAEDQPGIPVIFTSAQYCPAGAVQFEYSEFLPKPFSIDAMLVKVRSLLQKVSLPSAV